MYHFIENSIRGEISMISTRHAQANNPSFPATYDANLPRQVLIYLDANNLYGWAMSQFLSTHGFRLLQQGEISALKLQDLSDDEEDGYILDTFIIQPVYTINTMTIHFLPNRWRLTVTCIHSVFPESAPQKKLTPNLQDIFHYYISSNTSTIHNLAERLNFYDLLFAVSLITWQNTDFGF